MKEKHADESSRKRKLVLEEIKEQKVKKMKIEKKVELHEKKMTVYHRKHRGKKAFRLC